ncbi:MAG: lipopolysaccharide biosynthesis protein [Pseudomonadota bacterium]
MRLARNVGWLAGARGLTGVLSIVYLGFASRTLGARDFGTFALILTFGQLVANLVQFQSVKGVIRYGVIHLDKDQSVRSAQSARLARLFGAMATFDLLGIAAGAIIAVGAIPMVAGLFAWSGDRQVVTAAFTVALLLSNSGTPTGILRLFGRFDRLAMIEEIGPCIRVAGAFLAWLTGGEIAVFLAVWAVAALVQSAAQWWASLAIDGIRFEIGRRSFRKAIGENHRLWRFMLFTNLSNSLTLFWMQLGTLAVGAVAGPVQAGGFRIAQRVAKGIGNPVELVTRALYPEFAKMVAANRFDALGRVLVRTTLVASALATVTVLAVALGGKWILDVIAGAQFQFAYWLLVLLSISTAFDLASFALDPYHIAQGRPGRILRTRFVGALVYLAILALALPRLGASGAAYAAIAASAAMFAQLIQSARQIAGEAKRSAAITHGRPLPKRGEL